MKKITVIGLLCIVFGKQVYAQINADSIRVDTNKKETVLIRQPNFADCTFRPCHTVTPQQKKWRMPLVFGVTAGLYAGSFIGLNQLWYADYPKSDFQFINDNAEWYGLDKFGHAATAYYIGYYTQPIFQWSGLNHKAATWTAGGLAFAYQSTIEILDGFSAEWGASYGDWIANFGGAAMFVSQELVWKEQRFQLKMSYWPSEYAPLRPNLLGSNLPERLLKDYNAQTYWLTCNVWSFLPNRNASKFPKWLNIAVGYGGNGMLGGFENPAQFAHIPRYQQFYLSVDFDLTKIKTKSRFLKTLFRALSIIKIPAPAIEFSTNPNQPVFFHWMMF